MTGIGLYVEYFLILGTLRQLARVSMADSVELLVPCKTPESQALIDNITGFKEGARGSGVFCKGRSRTGELLHSAEGLYNSFKRHKQEFRALQKRLSK